MGAQFHQKILNSMVVGFRQSFDILNRKPGFLEKIDLCLNLGIEYCIA